MQSDITTSFGTLDHGRVVVGTTATALTSETVLCKKGVRVKASADNSEEVFLGNSDVTPGTVASTDGFILEAGEEVFIDINRVGSVYGVSTDVNQTLYWISV